MASRTITQWLTFNNLGAAQVGDYFVGNRGAGNTGGMVYAPKLNMDPSPSLAANLNVNGKTIVDANNIGLLTFTSITNAVNYLNIKNATTGAFGEIQGIGTDTNVGINIRAQNAAPITILSTSTNPLNIYSGTANQHLTTFNFANTSATRNVTFPDSSGTLAYNNTSLTIPSILDSNGNVNTAFTTTPSAVNSLAIANSATGNAIGLSAQGTDTNVGVAVQSKGTGMISLYSANTTTPMAILSGTGYQHITNFAFSNTANTRTLTFPDVTDTVLTQTSPTINTPTINGFTNGSVAGAGVVGQELQSSFTTGGAITSGVATAVNSLVLTAGDWLVSGTVAFLAGAGTTANNFFAAINTTSTSIPNPTTFPSAGAASYPFALASAGQNTWLSVPAIHVSVSTNTTYFLNAQVTYAVSTMTVNSGIVARRIR